MVKDNRVRPVALEPHGEVLEVGDDCNAVAHASKVAAGQMLALCVLRDNQDERTEERILARCWQFERWRGFRFRLR